MGNKLGETWQFTSQEIFKKIQSFKGLENAVGFSNNKKILLFIYLFINILIFIGIII